MRVFLLYVNGTFYAANRGRESLRDMAIHLKKQYGWKAEVWECNPSDGTLRLVWPLKEES